MPHTIDRHLASISTAALCALLLLMTPQRAAAQVGISIKGGTTGVGADLTIRLVERLNLRAGLSGFHYEDTVDLDDAEVDAELDIQLIPVLLDWHPAGTGFRLTAGAIFGNTEVGLSADDTVLTLDGTDFPVTALTGTITPGDTLPYIGLGYGNAADRTSRWHFCCDFGVIYAGNPEVSAAATTENDLLQLALNAALEAEVLELEDELEGILFYPVITLGVSFTF